MTFKLHYFHTFPIFFYTYRNLPQPFVFVNSFCGSFLALRTCFLTSFSYPLFSFCYNPLPPYCGPFFRTPCCCTSWYSCREHIRWGKGMKTKGTGQALSCVFPMSSSCVLSSTYRTSFVPPIFSLL